MSEKTSMFELLNERLEKEDIVKLVCDYDNKFNELEKENKQLKSQLQQRDNIIKEVREYIDKHTLDGNGTRIDYANEYIDVDELLEILDKVGSDK